MSFYLALGELNRAAVRDICHDSVGVRKRYALPFLIGKSAAITN